MRPVALGFAWLSTSGLVLACGGTVTGTGGSGGAGASSSSNTASTGGAGDAVQDGGGAVGAPCASNADCAPKETCATWVPGGYCTVVIGECSGDPFNPMWCPGDAWCVNGSVFGGHGGDYCMAICASASECRHAEGYACCPWGDAGVCFFGASCP